MQTTSPKPNYRPPDPPPRFKFLARNLDLRSHHTAIFQKISLKRLYLRKFLDHREPLSFKETSYRPLKKNNKILKILTEVQVPSFNQAHIYEILKNCKNIDTVILNLKIESAKTEKVARFVKRLASKTRVFDLNVLECGPAVNKDFCVLARSIRYLSKLESINRSCYFYHDKKLNNVSKELNFYSKSASRLKKIQDITYCVPKTDQTGFQRAMRKDNSFPGITGLDMHLSIEHFIHHQFDSTKDYSLPDFNKMTEDQKSMYLSVQEEIKKRDKNPEKGGDFHIENYRTTDRDFLVNCIMHEEMKPFFHFDLFPDLKSLGLFQEAGIYPFGSFVVDGFQSLRKLQRLHIDIYERPQGTSYIFKGLLNLPLLRVFNLSICFIKKADWLLLQEFLKKQNDLISLTLQVEDLANQKLQYQQQNVFLQNIIQDLQNKSSLRSLSLRLRSCSLEAISQGFSHLSIKNQLQVLIFEGIDDTVFSQEKPWRRIEGLCTFIKNQKSSLEILGVYLPFVLEENVVVHIAEAISKLTQLKEIEWFINPNVLGGIKYFQQHFGQTLQSEIPVDSRISPRASKQFNPNLAKYLKKLENLENFLLVFDVPDQNLITTGWISDVLKALPCLKRLQNLSISTYSINNIRSIESDFMKIIPELDYVREIKFPVFETEELLNLVCFILSPNPQLEKMINEGNKKKALRMF